MLRRTGARLTWILIIIVFAQKSFAQKIIQNKKSRSYYISNNGDDSSNGTRSDPFRTINRINTIGTLNSDTLYFKGEEYFKGTLNIQCKGTKLKQCIVSSYGNGLATLNGEENEAVILSGKYFIIKNLHLTGKGRKTGNIKNGISVINGKHGIIQHLSTDSFQKSGVSIYKCQNMVIRDVKANNNGFAGISIEGSSECTIKDCKAENNPGDPTNLTNHSGNGIIAGMCDHILIDHCAATNNGWNMPRTGNGPVGIWAYESSYITIQYCISYKNRTSTGSADGGGFDLDGGVKHSIIQYCLSYENEGSGYGLFQYSGATSWRNNILRYCISINDARKTKEAAGILIWNNSGSDSQLSHGYVYNNIIYNDSAPAVGFLSESLNLNFIFNNNIFLGGSKMISGPESGDLFTGNIYWSITNQSLDIRGFNDLQSWRKEKGQEKYNLLESGMIVNPMLKGPFKTNLTDPYKLKNLDGFRLQKGSLIIHKGTQIKIGGVKQPDHDFYNNKIKTGPTITPGIEQFQ